MSPALLSVATALAHGRAVRAPVGVVVQDVYSRTAVDTTSAGGAALRVAARLEGRLLRRATGVALAHERFRPAVTALGVPADNLTVLPNWTHVTRADAARALHEVAGVLAHREDPVHAEDPAEVAARRHPAPL